MLLKQSTARNVPVLMIDSSDHITGKTGLTLTITASKDGGAFASITPTVTELANGWYSLALTTTHTNTLGAFALHITGTGADATDVLHEVTALLPGEAVTLASGQKVDVDTIKTNPVVNAGTVTFPTGATLASTTNITAGTITTATNLTNAPTSGDLTAAMKASVTTAATAATPTVTAGTVTDKTGYALTSGERTSIADALLGRNIAGGSNAGRLVTDALRFLRNKWTVSAGTLTVFQEDDTTSAWTATVGTTAGADPITSNDPA